MTFIEECECTLIGQIILKPEIIRECVLYLSPECFSLPQTKRIYKEVLRLFNNGKQIDPIAVVSAMGSEKDEYKEFLLTCNRMVASTESYPQLINQLHTEYVKRRAVFLCSQLSRDIHNMDIETVREKISSLLSSFDRKDNVSTESVSAMYAEFMKYLSNDNPEILTGISSVDGVVTIDKGDFIIIGGRPSSGKTALALQMAMHIAKMHRVAFFSLETGCVKLFTRMLASGTQTDICTLRNRRKMTSQDEGTRALWQKINDFTLKTENELSFSFVSAAGWTVPQIRSKALQLGADVIFIDYLTLIASGSKSAYEKATEISRELHTLAQSEGITVFALAQLNRQSEHQEYPTMADLRESGQLEQDADSIMLLSPKREGDTSHYAPRTLHIVKNKDGDTGEADLIFRGEWQRFEEEI